MLKKLSNFPGIKGPVVTIVMDGFGITDKVEGNAIKAARTPTLDNLFKMYPNVLPLQDVPERAPEGSRPRRGYADQRRHG